MSASKGLNMATTDPSPSRTVSVDSALEPRLPPDLERLVFEYAAADDPPAMLQLILVAQRARAWIEPLLYRTLLLCQSSWHLPLLLHTLAAHPYAAQWVRALHIAPYIVPNAPCIARAVARCTRTQTLVDRSYGRTPLRILAALPLTRMCVALDTIDGLPDLASAPARDFAPFARLTHLHLLDAPARWGSAVAPLARALPALTHLALQNYMPAIRGANLPALRAILEDCARLHVLVVFLPLCGAQERRAQVAGVRCVVDDPRLVVLSEKLEASCELWVGKGGTAERCPEEAAGTEVVSYGACAADVWAPKAKTRRGKKRTSKDGIKIRQEV
ncbi:hypothetical protein DFH09DRAFT_1456500 [Mycena vulgaris]|nr:hypothetical protein DFH09DRAFT_1456500 [Mycena vulgaris]